MAFAGRWECGRCRGSHFSQRPIERKRAGCGIHFCNAFAPFFNVYFSQYIHLPMQKIGFVFAISQLSQVLAILFTPLIFRKFGLVTGIVYMQIATAVALGALAGVRSVSTAAFAYVIYMSFQWMSEPG
jgi:hypothetical protein